MSLLFIHFPPAADQRPDSNGDIRNISRAFNPLPVFRLMASPKILLTVSEGTIRSTTRLSIVQDMACGLLGWSQFSLLSAPRHIISDRFQIKSPLYSGLFYIAPATGFLVGTLVGGRYSDRTVKRWIVKRDGIRLPQDRLNSGMWSSFVVVPAASLVYGWSLEGTKDSIGWLALPIICAFFIAAGLTVAFASLNTYCSGRPIMLFGRCI